MRIRHAQPGDRAGIQAIFEQVHAASNTLQLPFQPNRLWEERLDHCDEHCINLVADDEGTIVGQLTLEPMSRARRKHVATLGMGVHVDHLGNGVGSALMATALDLADNWLNVHRVELEVYTDNAAALALYRKFGFEVEGTARDHAFRNGRYVDTHYMARIKASR